MSMASRSIIIKSNGSQRIQFLGFEISRGYSNHENLLKNNVAEFGGVQTIKDVERIIGVISYARRYVKDVEMIWAHSKKVLRP